ncbi:DNL zinc finger-domain-containing protein [Nemania sp. NC0429]|nr:DNL zinc finger-domain-containing protein [Nemania sp. NC0429]
MASKVALRPLATVLRPPRSIFPPVLQTLPPIGRRLAHVIPKPPQPAEDASSPSSSSTSHSSAGRIPPRLHLEPHYVLHFTCVPCGDRSSHHVSKQGYHRGSVLITCPSCRNRHVISDNLNIFGDRRITVDQLLREKGQLVKRGTLGEEGDIEFWQDNPPEPADAGETSVDAGQATAASVEAREDEHHDDATNLRETRDPSSQATDPVPHSASVLSGSTSTRPSMHHVSHQSPAPSTRRQFNVKIFNPPRGLLKGNTPLKPPNPFFETEYMKAQRKIDLPTWRERRSRVKAPNIRHIAAAPLPSTIAAPDLDVLAGFTNPVGNREGKTSKKHTEEGDAAPHNEASADDHTQPHTRPNEFLPYELDWDTFMSQFKFNRPNDFVIRRFVGASRNEASPDIHTQPNKASVDVYTQTNKAPVDESDWDAFEKKFESARPSDFTHPRLVFDMKGAIPGPRAIQAAPGIVLRKRPPGGMPTAPVPATLKRSILWRPPHVPIVPGDPAPGDSAASDFATSDSTTSDSVTEDSSVHNTT